MREIFLLVYHLGLGYEEVRRMPISYRTWFLQELQSELKKSTSQNGDDAGVDSASFARLLGGGARGGAAGRRAF